MVSERGRKNQYEIIGRQSYKYQYLEDNLANKTNLKGIYMQKALNIIPKQMQHEICASNENSKVAGRQLTTIS